MRKTSEEGVALIKRHEGCRLTAYRCPAGVPTIGYGHTGKDVRMGMTISQAQADELLRKDLEVFERSVESAAPQTLTQHQFDALVSFAFNLGPAALRSSTLMRKVRQNASDPAIRAEFAKWVVARGKRLPGLVARRKDEADLYFKP